MAKTVSITISAVDQYSSTFAAYNNAVREASQQNETITTSSGKTATAMDQLAGNIQGAIVAFAGMRGIQLVGDLLETGQKANIAAQTFDALTSKIGGAALNMAALRTATSGATDDVTLMTGANKLLQMGLANNTDEMSKLAQMALQLGGSMGMGPQKSFSDFALLLGGQSIMRLDQFGISSSRVRDRMQELQSTMDKSEAFKLAVLEEGQAALDRLGTAASGAETPLARLEATAQNLYNIFTADLSTGANSLIGILEIMTGNNPIQKAQQQQQEQLAQMGEANATAYADRFKSALTEAFQGSDFSIADVLGEGQLPDEILKKSFTNMKGGMSATDSVQNAIGSFDYNSTVGYSDEAMQRIASVTLQMLQQAEAAERTQKAQQEIVQQQELLHNAQMLSDEDKQSSMAQQQAARDYALGSVTGSDIAKTTGAGGQKLKPAEITSQMAIDIQQINKDSAAAGVNMDKISASIKQSATYSEMLKKALETMKTSAVFTLDLQANDPSGILGLIKASMNGSSLAEIVKDAGGKVPGQSSGGGRASRDRG